MSAGTAPGRRAAAGEPTLRSYAAGDHDVVVDLLTRSEPWSRLGYDAATWDAVLALPLRGRESHVIERGGRAAGIALVKPRFLAGDYLEVLAVPEADRGQGLGGRLLAHVEDVAFARGRNVFVCVSDFNTRARAFYARHGYVEVGPLDDLLVRGSAEILLRKTAGPVRA